MKSFYLIPSLLTDAQSSSSPAADLSAIHGLSEHIN